MIKNDALRAYAATLQDAGFAIYEPSGRSGDYFVYSREVDGVERFGIVQAERFDGYSHTMPIRPSKENGSSMFVDGVEDGLDCLTVEAARIVASPKNHNPLVGTQENYYGADWLKRLYNKR